MRIFLVLVLMFVASVLMAARLTPEQIEWCKGQNPALKKDECKAHFGSAGSGGPGGGGPGGSGGGGSGKLSADSSFFIQITGNTRSMPSGYDVYITDLFDAGPSDEGISIAYFSAGSWEDWRPDADQFPESSKGRSNGWPGEKWLDIRNIKDLEPIMAARMDLAVERGFDGVDPDNVDGYTNRTGFKLSAGDQLKYNRMLVDLAKERGLLIGLKNNVEQADELAALYDFSVNEQCIEYGECGQLSKFVNSGKPVLQIEYRGLYCEQAAQLGVFHVRKKLSLNKWVRECK